MEIPTYPYDSEYAGFPLVTRLGIQVDKVFRKTLAKHVNAIVTFSDYHCIFGQRTIQISNGVDFDSIPLKKTVSKNTSVIHLLGVAEVHYWHGYDRLIEGLGKYYQNPQTQPYFSTSQEVYGNPKCMIHNTLPDFMNLSTNII